VGLFAGLLLLDQLSKDSAKTKISTLWTSINPKQWMMMSKKQ